MRTKKKYSVISCLFAMACFPGMQCLAQSNPPADSPDSFAYYSALDSVQRPGFYHIALSPDMIAKCREDLADLRLAGSSGPWLGYVLRSDQPVFTSENFIGFPILSNKQLKDSTTEILIENQSATPIENLLLVIMNSNVVRTATLSGSDDKQHWFAIREQIVLEEAGSYMSDHYVQEIAFPPSSYRFFKLILDDKGKPPLNVLRAGISTLHTVSGKFVGIPFPALIQKDSSDKHTYISLQYRDHYRIDKLELILQGPPWFRRHAVLYDNRPGSRSRLAETDLSPGQTAFLLQAPVKTDRLLVEIDNGDDKPLNAEAARTAGLNQYLLAWLPAGTGYRLFVGDPHAELPRYDLRFIADSMQRNPMELAAGPLLPIPHGPAVLAPQTGHSVILLWIVLIVVLILLTWLSMNMARSIPKNKT